MIAHGCVICLSFLPGMLKADDDNLPILYNYDFTNFVAWLEENTVEKDIPGSALAIVSREGIMQLETLEIRLIVIPFSALLRYRKHLLVPWLVC